MKEIPMLFSTPMVQAILDGRKTMTRRLVDIPDLLTAPDRFRFIGSSIIKDIPRPAIKYDDRVWYEWQLTNSNEASWVERCRWKVGDLLWVRESWNKLTYSEGDISFYGFRADPSHPKERKWKPSIHMPKEAARIWLPVTNIRVERLQDISEEDAKAEGVKPAHCESNKNCPSSLCKNGCSELGTWWNYNVSNGEGFPAYSAKESFETLWQSINGYESWEANPWVWVVSFKVLSTTGKPDLQNLK